MAGRSSSPSVWCAPASVFDNKQHQILKSGIPHNSLVARMVQPSVARPSWYHLQQYQRMRRESSRLQCRNFEEIWNTISERRPKAETRTIMDSSYSGLRSVQPTSSDLKNVGSQFDIQEETPEARTRCEQKLIKNNSRSLTVPTPSINTDQPNLSHVISTCGSSTAFGSYHQSLKLTSVNKDMYSNEDENLQIYPDSICDDGYQIQPNPTTDVDVIEDEPKIPCFEYPDLFWAHDPVLYAPYANECLRYYKNNFKEFMRRGLQKHVQHIKNENISPEVLSRAMKVPKPKGKLSEAKKRRWYLEARNMLFRTSPDEPIKACENSGTHDLELGKRTYNRKKPASVNGLKRPRTGSISSAVTGNVDHGSTNPDVMSRDSSQLQRNSLAIPSAPSYSQPFPLEFQFGQLVPNHVRNHEYQYYGAGDSTDIIRTSPNNSHDTIGSQIQSITARLSSYNESLPKTLYASTNSQDMIDFRDLLRRINEQVDEFITRKSGVQSANIFPHTAQQYLANGIGNASFTASHPQDQQSSSLFYQLTSGSSGHTPGDSTDQQGDGLDWT